MVSLENYYAKDYPLLNESKAYFIYPQPAGTKLIAQPNKLNEGSPRNERQLVEENMECNFGRTADVDIDIRTIYSSCSMYKYGDSIDIKGITSIVTDRLSTAGERYYKKLYATRLSRLSSKESYWLHQDMTMQQVYEKYIKKHPSSERRYELRMRYFSSNLQDLCEKDNVTFYFYYDQVRG
ncbi:hypothetical protein WA026_006258 [Henosepilachna vigintioctopunctata]|uniref:FERM domain-containing protein n=1 Tax=Henosepilachna vigintioctopunctata TaxID=420089 RepID=A0AAW1TP22_9CUCU